MNNDAIRSPIYTCHDSSAVVTCVKLWPDLIIIFKVTDTSFFLTSLQLWIPQFFVKWTIDLSATPHLVVYLCSESHTEIPFPLDHHRSWPEIDKGVNFMQITGPWNLHLNPFQAKIRKSLAAAFKSKFIHSACDWILGFLTSKDKVLKPYFLPVVSWNIPIHFVEHY